MHIGLYGDLASTVDAVDGCLQAALNWTNRKLTMVDASDRGIAEVGFRLTRVIHISGVTGRFGP
jgi:hypothetical protein